MRHPFDPIRPRCCTPGLPHRPTTASCSRSRDATLCTLRAVVALAHHRARPLPPSGHLPTARRGPGASTVAPPQVARARTAFDFAKRSAREKWR